jgi:hypothetical protein
MRIALFSCLVVLLIAVVWFIVPDVVDAQGVYPLNGDFELLFSYWIKRSGSEVITGSCFSGSYCVRLSGISGVRTDRSYAFGTGSYLSFAARSSVTATLYLYPIFYPPSSMSFTSVVFVVPGDSAWHGYFPFVTGSGSESVQIGIYLEDSGSTVDLDYVNLNWFLPSGFPYGAQTPIPIDWLRYPSPVPYPTFPAWPTPDWSAFPTAISNVTNNNTTNNTTSNTTNNNSYGGIGNATINVTGGLTLNMTPFPYGAGTPIPMYDASTRTPTPTPVLQSQAIQRLAWQSAPSTPQFYINPASPASAGDLSVGSGTNSSSPFDLVMTEELIYFDFLFSDLGYPYTTITFGLPDWYFTIHYKYPTKFIFAGQDLLNQVYAIMSLFYFVTCLAIIRKG